MEVLGHVNVSVRGMADYRILKKLGICIRYSIKTLHIC